MNTKELTYGPYTETEVLRRINFIDEKELKAIEFAMTESAPTMMYTDLFCAPHVSNDDAKAFTLLYMKCRKDMVKAVKDRDQAIKDQKAFAKKNLGAPFVGQRLYSCYGYDATIYEWYTVTRVSKKSVWVKADDTRIFPKVMCRRISWDNKEHTEWSCKIDDVRRAYPDDGTEKDDDWND